MKMESKWRRDGHCNESRSFILTYVKPQQVKGGYFIPTLERFKHSNCGLVNVVNKQVEECFRWSMFFRQSEKKNNVHRFLLNTIKYEYVYNGIIVRHHMKNIELVEEFCYVI